MTLLPDRAVHAGSIRRDSQPTAVENRLSPRSRGKPETAKQTQRVHLAKIFNHRLRSTSLWEECPQLAPRRP